MSSSSRDVTVKIRKDWVTSNTTSRTVNVRPADSDVTTYESVVSKLHGVTLSRAIQFEVGDDSTSAPWSLQGIILEMYQRGC